MPPRSFLALCLLLAPLVGCASSPPPTLQQPAYLVMVQQRPGMLWRLPDPPDVRLQPPAGPTPRTASEQLDDAVGEFEDFATGLNIRIERLLAQTPPRLPMPGSCTSRCTPHRCTCN